MRVRTDLHQLLSQVEQPFDLVVVFEEVGDGDLQESQLIGNHIKVVAAAAVSEVGLGVSNRHWSSRLDRPSVKILQLMRKLLGLVPFCDKVSEVDFVVVSADELGNHIQLFLIRKAVLASESF